MPGLLKTVPTGVKGKISKRRADANPPPSPASRADFVVRGQPTGQPKRRITSALRLLYDDTHAGLRS
jgi:hypothetical protein